MLDKAVTGRRRLSGHTARRLEAAVTAPTTWNGRISATLQAWARQPRHKGRTGVLDPFAVKDELHPFKLPEEEIQRLAQDEASQVTPSLAWAGAAIGSIFDEGMTFLGYPYLSELSQRPEYRRISEIISTEMTRKWIKIKSKSDDGAKSDKIKKIEEEFERLKVQETFQTAALQDGFFGRSHIFYDFEEREDIDFRDLQDEELEKPLVDSKGKVSAAKVSPDRPLVAMTNIEPVWAYPMNYNSSNPLARNWYKPAHWFVLTQKIHKSRLVTFVGREVPDLLKPAYSFGGLSLSQMAKPYIDNWLRTRQSVSDLVNSFSIPVLKTILGQVMQPGGDQLFERVDFFNNCRDNKSTFILDNATEAFENVSAPLGTLDVLQAQSQEHVCSVSGIPLVKYTGLEPHGLNATSEGSIKVWYDWIRAYQKHFYWQNLNYTLQVTQMSLFGEVDDDITAEFEALDDPDVAEEAGVKYTKAQTDEVLINAGVLHPEEARQRIADDASSDYQDIDVDDVPDLQQEEAAGLEPRGARLSGAGGDEEMDDAGAMDGFSIAQDDAASFVESDHPRDADGKFAKYGTSDLAHSTLASKGYQKQKLGGAKGSTKLEYHHPETGHKLVIEPPKGTAGKTYKVHPTSTEWTHYHGVKGEGGKFSMKTQGKGAKELSQHLDSLGGIEHRRRDEAAPKPSSHQKDTFENWMNYEPSGGQLNSEQEEVLKGSVFSALFNQPEMVRQLTDKFLTPKSASKPAAKIFDAVAQHAYTYSSKAASNILEYTKEIAGKGTSKLQINSETGQWTLETPKHMTKTGVGSESLDALMSGDMDKWQAAGVANAPDGMSLSAAKQAGEQQEKAMTALAEKQKNAGALEAATKEAQAKAQAKLQADKKAGLELSKKLWAHMQEQSKQAAAIRAPIVKVRPPTTSAQDAAISAYKGSSYDMINDNLRTKGEHSKETLALASWLENASIPEDTTLYRGIKSSYAEVIRGAIEGGGAFKDRGFVSMSASSQFSNDWAHRNEEGTNGGMLLKVTVKKGAKGAAIKSSIDGEHEIVFQHGCRFKVIKANFHARYAHVELLSHEEDPGEATEL